MFNTFSSEHQTLVYKRNKSSQQKRKNVEITNLSAIQLNPWNDEGIKSFVYLEGENFISPKLSFNFSPTFKQSPQKNLLKDKQKKLNNQTKKQNIKQDQKNHLIQSKQKRFLQAKKQQINLMNKTISVHNFQGEKVFNQTHSFNRERRKSLNIEKQKNSRKTIISNPMYLKFCNTYVSQKQKLTRKRKTVSDFDLKNIDFQSEKIEKIKEKMTTFSAEKGDIYKAKNIHQVRRRLKSNSQLSKRNQFQNNQTSKQSQNRIFYNQKLNKCHTIKLQPQKTINQQQMQKVKIEIDKQKQDQNEDKSTKKHFKLGQRKNLYIGYRKFFHPLYHVIGKDRTVSVEDQFIKKEIINFQSLQRVVDLQIIKKNYEN